MRTGEDRKTHGDPVNLGVKKNLAIERAEDRHLVRVRSLPLEIGAVLINRACFEPGCGDARVLGVNN